MRDLLRELRRLDDVPDGNDRHTTALQDALFNVWAEADDNVNDYEIGERLAEAAVQVVARLLADPKHEAQKPHENTMIGRGQ